MQSLCFTSEETKETTTKSRLEEEKEKARQAEAEEQRY
jgi:hypothetical protein